MTLLDISKSGGFFKRLGGWSGLRSATTRSAKIPRKYIKTSIWHCLEVHEIVGMGLDEMEVLRGYIFSESTRRNNNKRLKMAT